MKNSNIPSLKQLFNKHTAIPAALTICMGIITLGAVSNFVDYPGLMTGAWMGISGIFTAVNANSWKARATGRPFFNMY